MREPNKVTLYDHTGREVIVTLDPDMEDKGVYINLDGKELLLPANWALTLAQNITLVAKESIEGKEEQGDGM